MVFELDKPRYTRTAAKTAIYTFGFELKADFGRLPGVDKIAPGSTAFGPVMEGEGGAEAYMLSSDGKWNLL
jgi:hypothetical protein